MYTGRTLFSQVMDFVPWTSFNRIVAKYRGDRDTRTLVARNISGLWRLLKSRIVRACATSKPVLGRNLQNCAAWACADPSQNQHWQMQTNCAIGSYGLIWRLS